MFHALGTHCSKFSGGEECEFQSRFDLLSTGALPPAHPFLLLLDWPKDLTSDLAGPQHCSDLQSKKALLFLGPQSL
ncbi:MAG: hypothetical protein KDD22_06740 [Bdellovibrionales bacterium]|nr:hypothetical protein [Bdellovibrionales bacterium]